VVDTATQRFEDMADGIDLVFDTVGRDLLERSWAVVSRGGTLVTISGEAEDAPSPDRARELGIEAAWFIVSPNPGQLAQLASWVLDGRIKVKIDAVYPLDDAPRVFREAAGRAHAGKTVLKI